MTFSEESILQTIKSMLDLDIESEDFDTDVITNINAAFLDLSQLGVGPEQPFVIKGVKETWSDFLGEKTEFEACKLFIYMKTKLGFDPPSSSFVINSLEKQLEKLEWRLMVQAEGSDQNELSG